MSRGQITGKLEAAEPKKTARANLMRSRRFGPFFWTQFSGAFNDNLFKTALAVMLVYHLSYEQAGTSHLMVNLAAGLFILPFFLLSALAGQVADKYEKAHLIRRIKLAEIIIMATACFGLIFNQSVVLLGILFLMGSQSAFFSPLKYSLLPQHLKPGELITGNGLIQMGTHMAILIGTMCGGVLMAAGSGRYWVAAAVFITALSGWLFSRRIPHTPAADSTLRIKWDLIAQTREMIVLAARDRARFLGILGISWFWFLGSVYVTQLPNFVRQVMRCDASVTTLLLGVFTVGVAAGSLLCSRLSGRWLEVGLIPAASLGLSLFGWDIANLSAPAGGPTVATFITGHGGLRVLIDWLLLGACGGIYIVPLLVLVQKRSPHKIRSRVIAANNILNAGFMAVSAICSAVLLSALNVSLPTYLFWLATVNLLVGIYICWKVQLSAMRLAICALMRTIYRLRCHGMDRIPDRGAAILVCNHVSYVDALIIAAACRRPIRFVMYNGIYRMAALNWFFKLTRTIPIDSATTNPAVLKRALDQIDTALKNGELVCLFPEGCLTKNGAINRFRPGIEKIVQRTPVPVIPLALRGLWGSFFSHKDGKAFTRWPRRFHSRIELSVGRMMPPRLISADGLRSIVLNLRGNVL